MPSRPGQAIAALWFIASCVAALAPPVWAASESSSTGSVSLAGSVSSADSVSSLTPCEICRDTGACSLAYDNSPGQFCYDWTDILDSTRACCCAASDVCSYGIYYQCLCNAPSTDSWTDNPGDLDYGWTTLSPEVYPSESDFQTSSSTSVTKFVVIIPIALICGAIRMYVYYAKRNQRRCACNDAEGRDNPPPYVEFHRGSLPTSADLVMPTPINDMLFNTPGVHTGGFAIAVNDNLPPPSNDMPFNSTGVDTGGCAIVANDNCGGMASAGAGSTM